MKKILSLLGLIAVAACTNGGGYNNGEYYDTPTVDYVESLDLGSADQPDSFLNQLAMNYRSYAIFNARQSGYPDIGEMFAQKAIVAFSDETPLPESLGSWEINDQSLVFELSSACQELVNMLKNDMSDYCPVEAAEAQAKFDCWLTASASGQDSTANECRARFHSVMEVFRSGGPKGCGAKPSVSSKSVSSVKPAADPEIVYYPDPVGVLPAQMRAREGIIVVVNPEPVPPIVVNQNIYGGDKTIAGNSEEESVSRQEFIEMMQIMREEIRVINDRLDQKKSERTVLKVQQIPLEPKQHVMEEIFEVNFDFDKAIIKPEYEEVIHKLAKTTQENRNVKVSVVGHTDTTGSQDYNYALGGRRAKSVRDMLVKYGIPSDQIVIVSSGKNDLKVSTGDQVKNSENRRARVIKEQRYIEQPEKTHITALVEQQGFDVVEE